MNIKTLTKLTLTASVALVLSACNRGKSDAKTAVPVVPKVVDGKHVDECPSADGKWDIDGGLSVEFGRKEGHLTLKQAELTEPVVMDGKARKIKEVSSNLEIEVTGSCKDRLATITQKNGNVTVSQIFYISINDGSLWMDEQDGDQFRQLTFKRPAPPLPESQHAN